MHSRLDYCNNLFAGLPANQLTRLQSVLRPAARLVFRLPGRAIVTEAIRDCAALANCHTASDLRVVLAGIQVSLRSGTRLSGSALCVIVWRCCSFVAACPAPASALKRCQVRLTLFLLLYSCIQEYSNNPTLSAIFVSGLLQNTSQGLFCIVRIVAIGAFVTILVNYGVCKLAVLLLCCSSSSYYYCYYYYYFEVELVICTTGAYVWKRWMCSTTGPQSLITTGLR